jgi:hypothetical protein
MWIIYYFILDITNEIVYFVWQVLSKDTVHGHEIRNVFQHRFAVSILFL